MSDACPPAFIDLAGRLADAAGVVAGLGALIGNEYIDEDCVESSGGEHGE